MQMKSNPALPTIGLALGSGSARGWSHIGVIQELEAIGVRPQVVAGTSVGALVGAVYVSGQLNEFAEWLVSLNVRDVIRLMDFKLSGGMMKGERLFTLFNERHSNPNIQDLDQRYASVATEMASGREIWITRGPVFDAARASCAMPGLFAPVKWDDRWMLDGGLVNPVPVSTCRALGADVVIAVNLNTQIIGRHLSRAGAEEAQREAGERDAQTPNSNGFWQKLTAYFESDDADNPGFFDVVAASINIMQDRLTRSRMAGDPPEVTLLPQLGDFALMDFHRAPQAIEEGRRLVQLHAAEIRSLARLPAAADAPARLVGAE
jgi:NTE family protein